MHISVECDPECLNGGVCVGPNICNCTGTGFTGDICQIREFCDLCLILAGFKH